VPTFYGKQIPGLSPACTSTSHAYHQN